MHFGRRDINVNLAQLGSRYAFRNTINCSRGSGFAGTHIIHTWFDYHILNHGLTGSFKIIGQYYDPYGRFDVISC